MLDATTRSILNMNSPFTLFPVFVSKYAIRGYNLALLAGSVTFYLLFGSIVNDYNTP